LRRWIAAAAAALAVAVGSVTALSAQALPVAPEPVAPITGIPAPCVTTHAFPADDSISSIKKKLTKYYGFELTGPGWTEANRESIRIVWETIDAMECTSYIDDLQDKVDGNVGLNATSISGYAWGDWSLTKTGYVSFDFTKFKQAIASGDEGRLTRLVAHELAHVLNSDRFSSPAYWKKFLALYAQEGRFSDYAGSSVTETWADVVGYYVGRCALNNPYDTGRYDAYYDFVKEYVFDGKEFGPAAGTTSDCSVPDEDAETPMPGAADGSWLEGLSGE